MLFLLRDRPESREEHATASKTLAESLDGRGIDLRAGDEGLTVYGEPVPDSRPLAAALRTHLLDRGIGELRIDPPATPDVLLAVLRALVPPPGVFRSIHEMAMSLESAVRDQVFIAPPAPDEIDMVGSWSAYQAISPGIERQAEELHRPSDAEADQMPELLADIEENPDDPSVADRLNEVVRASDELAARGDWVGVLRAASVLVASERSAREGGNSRVFGIAIRRMLPRSVLEQIARLTPSLDHRPEVIPVLQRLGADSTETLLGLLASAERIEERRAYFGALRQMTEGTDLLVNMLTHDEWYVVRNVADLCGEMRLESSVSRLARHANHGDERVRRSVAGALAKIGTPPTVDPLRQLLRDPSPAVRLQGLQNVGEQNRGLAMSIAVLLDSETHPDVLHELMMALARIGTSDAVQALVRAAEPGGRFFRRKPQSTRLAAVEALGAAGSTSAAAALRNLTSDADEEIRRAAERALATAAE
ncbi:MAG TPA: HEAT repeat domain-containing protein [Gemmatimonadales bacterium]|nr:HEAT repeat domain-containing protein [Gemmatimonadales bacterium]